MNSKLVKQFKDTLNISKTDKLDCFNIVRLLPNSSSNTRATKYLVGLEDLF